MKWVLLGLVLMGLGMGNAMACGGRSPYFGEGIQPFMGHSYANDDQFLIKHLNLRLWVNFEKKEIEGWVEYDLVHTYLRDTRPAAARRTGKINPITGNHILVLDHRDMDVLGVYAGGTFVQKTGNYVPHGKAIVWSVGQGDSDTLLFGRPLEIEVPRSQSKIVIHYRTRPSAGALQWLSPAQTYDQTHPFLFSQSQAILARTWIPLQDKPSVRFTYSAEVRLVGAAAEGGGPDCIGVPDALNSNVNPSDFNVVMSAVKRGNPEGDWETFTSPTAPTARCWPTGNRIALEKTGRATPNKVHRFEQKKPIPSYLMAIAVGSFGYKSLGKNTGVFAEHKLLEKAAWEFADLQKMVDAASDMFGEYAWGNYNVLVLPPSFPFGGMENPVVTFATPTIIAGDRSLVSLLAHELAHSWSGNLVTNRTWDDFWLNEGFTVYVESRIMERLYGADYADILRVLGKGELEKTLTWMLKDAPNDSHLRLHLNHRDPDEGLTDIAYEKGRFFLMMLEQYYGRQTFDIFLNGYFKNHAFRTVTTDIFLADIKKFHRQFLEEYVEKGNLNLAVNVCGTNMTHLTQEQLWSWDSLENKILAWIDGPGLPPLCRGGFPYIESRELKRVDAQIEHYFNARIPSAWIIDTTGFTTPHHWIHFLRQLHTDKNGQPRSLSISEMVELDLRFGFTKTKNAEIACDWFILSAHSDYRLAYPAMQEFLLKVGRRKFLLPIYEALLAQNMEKWVWPLTWDGRGTSAPPDFLEKLLGRSTFDASLKMHGKEMATEIFLQAEPGYHSVAARSIREMLGLPLTGGSGR